MDASYFAYGGALAQKKGESEYCLNYGRKKTKAANHSFPSSGNIFTQKTTIDALQDSSTSERISSPSTS
ncbi:uncharacterized protein PHALS_13243 [Plasmopara halstedii]|uniref:Uncharacterized protein n=1 Tax=Plasmopara halstedii TaxID=4781 RepID=A0A0P1ANK8_PLAHL|nr:uncharacterized protein PHALS_13243 [Plasmopara halstedii]CEG43018.1 hypothetical protein PHALS_13243 [Plasmopara halstedii]|eukprot:XP_024579387.1 hypothetical protein PHALS_13243 [Plasmopara halstedii]